MHRLRHAIAASLLVASTLAGAAPTQTAHAFVVSLYDGYRKPGGLQPLGAKAASVFTPALVALIRQDAVDADGEEGALGVDPICACQDFAISHVVVQVTDTLPTTASADVYFDNAATHQAVRLDLAQVNGQWRVADVHAGQIASLVDFLKKAHADAVADQAGARKR